MRLRSSKASLVCAAIALVSCATVPEKGGGGENLPNAAAGPFRDLVTSELGNFRSTPNALDDDTSFVRDPAVIDADGDPATLDVIGFFGATLAPDGGKPSATDSTNAIVRYGALDARSFDRAAEAVLTAQGGWEGNALGAPAVVRSGGELFLYYAAKGGIGLAKSGDGHAFARVSGPVLGPSSGGWEAGATPASPGVVRLDDGSFRMFYEIAITAGGSAIGEASSPDGVTWTRVGDGPALSPGSGDAGADAAYDVGGVGSPFPILATTQEGRRVLRVYYGARDSGGNAVIGLAARYGATGELQRATAPVYGSGKTLGPREPCVIAYPGFTLLFATQRAAKNTPRPAVAVGVAPGTAVLPAANPK